MPPRLVRPRLPVRRLVGALACAALAGGAVVGASACRAAEGRASAATPAPPVDGRLFTQLPSSYTGVTFANRLTESAAMNVFTYRNFYNGGGVAVGDLTGDGLPDLVLTANQGGPRLYVNAGRFQFRDATRSSGLGGAERAWTTGVTLADVNGDGRLDVYLCNAGPGAPATRANELWINAGPGRDGTPHFTEQARAYGVADEGWSTQAAWLDYDRDGDLDLLVVNNSPRPVTGYGVFYARMTPDRYGGAKLYRHDAAPNGRPRFVEVTERAGILSPENAFGLGVAVGDVNRDGWPDVYVSNDFFERDYLYVNRGDGTFAEGLDRAMPVLSQFSMGLDVADLDNDGWPDVYTTDMLPEDQHRLRTASAFEGWDLYQSTLRNGYHHQLMRNALQRNNGDGTFSDVAWMAGVARTDWSWGALAADLDLDGRKDLFVTNGVARDVTSQDYIAYAANEQAMGAGGGAGQGGGKAEAPRGPNAGGDAGAPDYVRLTNAMPSTPIANYAFRNDGGGRGGLAFSNQARAWGLDAPSFSSGAAYGDLDGDGAPDLVVNNVNGEAFVYRNNARALLPDRHALPVQLEGAGMNRFGVGARVTVRAGAATMMQEQAPTRGFASSVDPVLTFGLGSHRAADTLTVEWPDGRTSVLAHVPAGRRVTVRQADARPGRPGPARPPLAAHDAGLLAAVADSTVLDAPHQENGFVDFDRDRLVPHLLSTEGPALAVADVDGDGLDDVFLGGARGRPSRLMRQRPDGRFTPADSAVFAADAASEAVGAAFFDANGDGRPDLYVVSGGSEPTDADTVTLQDHLYLNDGRGAFRPAPRGSLPVEAASGSRVVPADYDGDGDVDLFVGGRVVPGRYGEPARSLLLRNDGRGRFTDAADRLAPGLARAGMVTDAAWADVDGDRRPDLVVVGEWMPVTVFHNAGGGRLVRQTPAGLARSHGWWTRVLAGDFTGDGRVDFVVGNLGLNTRLQADSAHPATMTVKDFDGNGIVEQIVATYDGGRSWPLLLRDDLLRALPGFRARFPSYAAFAEADMARLLTPAERAGARVDTAETFASVLVRNDGGGRFTLVPLPDAAQRAPVGALLAADVDRDGVSDLLVAGNFDGFKPDVGRAAAGYGLVLRGDGRGGFTPMGAVESGFFAPGQARGLARVRTRAGAVYVVARNNDRPLLFRPTSFPRPNPR